ncbi:glycoside hydrolase family 30 protein [Luteipulveratus mongoliensis]|uniref:glycoside hydrolase family 30 protein n=1 Tax=Luteipulveratus mongoliensis TaxID=571913 RepID=UPI00146FCA13|nr:glycoside hydrolase family 30 beta sandwich domain-containing protein [Luteipulveratus mongoliensis]
MTLDARDVRQPIEGFGAAFTDSSAYQLTRLKKRNPTHYAQVMQHLFNTRTGLGLNVMRVPMGSSDFTAESHHWTDADRQGPREDPLHYFALSPAETSRLIPVIKDALAINPSMHIVATPWSAPAWMKEHHSLIGQEGGSLRPEYYNAWADYFVRWIRGLKAHGVPVWGVTVQNEPYFAPADYPGMPYSASELATFTKSYLAPALKAANLRPVIVAHDHNWANATEAKDELSGDRSFVGAVGWHCYNNEAGTSTMTAVHRIYPDLPQHVTECSSDTASGDLIRYSTAELALRSTQHWARSVVLWNLALGPGGTPHLGGCQGCRGLLTVTDTGESWTPIRDQLGQVARFVRPGAWHISSTEETGGVVTSAFVNRDGTQVLVAHNPTTATVAFSTRWTDRGGFDYRLPAGATVTFRAARLP